MIEGNITDFTSLPANGESRKMPPTPPSLQLEPTSAEAPTDIFTRPQVFGKIRRPVITERDNLLFTSTSLKAKPKEQTGVVVTPLDNGSVTVADGKDPASPLLVYTQAEWDAFTEGAKDEEFDMPQFTKRQREVIYLKAKGLTNKEIAQELGIAPNTVKDHSSHINKKSKARNPFDAMMYAVNTRTIDTKAFEDETVGSWEDFFEKVSSLTEQERIVFEAMINRRRQTATGDAARQILQKTYPYKITESVVKKLGTKTLLEAGVRYRLAPEMEEIIYS